MGFANDTTLDSGHAMPEVPTNDGSSAGSGVHVDGQGYTTSSESSSQSGTNWKSLVFLFLGAVGILLFVAVVVPVVQTCRRRQRRSKASHNNDNANDDHNNHNNGTTADHTTNHDDKPTRCTLPMLAMTLALALSIATHASCDFVQLDGDPAYLALGLWRSRYQYTPVSPKNHYPVQYRQVPGGECRSNFRTDDNDLYDEQQNLQQDGPFVVLAVARVAATMATVLGGLSLLVGSVLYITPEMWTQGTTNSRRRLQWGFSATLVMAAVTQLVTLCFQRSDQCSQLPSEDCFLDSGAICTILASYFW